MEILSISLREQKKKKNVQSIRVRDYEKDGQWPSIKFHYVTNIKKMRQRDTTTTGNCFPPPIKKKWTWNLFDQRIKSQMRWMDSIIFVFVFKSKKKNSNFFFVIAGENLVSKSAE